MQGKVLSKEKDNLVIHYKFETEGVKKITRTINQR